MGIGLASLPDCSPRLCKPFLQAQGNGKKIVNGLQSEVLFDFGPEKCGNLVGRSAPLKEGQDGAGEAVVLVARPIGYARDPRWGPTRTEVVSLQPTSAGIAVW